MILGIKNLNRMPLILSLIPCAPLSAGERPEFWFWGCTAVTLLLRLEENGVMRWCLLPSLRWGWDVLPLYAVDIWLNCAPLFGHLHYGYGSPKDWPIYSDKGGWSSNGYPKLCRINGAASTGRCMKHSNRMIKPTVVAILLSRITMVRMWCPSRCIADLQRALTIDKLTT